MTEQIGLCLSLSKTQENMFSDNDAHLSSTVTTRVCYSESVHRLQINCVVLQYSHCHFRQREISHAYCYMLYFIMLKFCVTLKMHT